MDPLLFGPVSPHLLSFSKFESFRIPVAVDVG